MVIRKMLIVMFWIGLLITLFALAGLVVGRMSMSIQSLPTGEGMTAAWIGFAGSIIGALLAVVVALLALWPAYRQMGEMKRSSSVQAGQILRTRLGVLQKDWNVLLKNTFEGQMPKLLSIRPDDSRESWMDREPQSANEIREKILPRIEEVHAELIFLSIGVDLPELNRSDYIQALQTYADMLRTVLNGITRTENGARGPVMSAAQWRAHVDSTLAFASGALPKARLDYNNVLNAAQGIIRWQIIQADRLAIGPENAKLFDEAQKQALKQPR